MEPSQLALPTIPFFSKGMEVMHTRYSHNESTILTIRESDGYGKFRYYLFLKFPEYLKKVEYFPSLLMSECTIDADKERATLHLVVSPPIYSTVEDVIEWAKAWNFVSAGSNIILKREPQDV